MRKFLNESWLVLVMGVGFALLLAGAQAAFGPRIAHNKREALEKAVLEVVPGEASFQEIPLDGGRSVFKCFDDRHQQIGWAIPASGFGFQDKIELVLGLSPDGRRVTGLDILENKETPGLGNKIDDQPFRGQFRGLDAGSPIKAIKGKRQDADHEIDAITGATISSESVVKIVNQAVTEVGPRLSGLK